MAGFYILVEHARRVAFMISAFYISKLVIYNPGLGNVSNGFNLEEEKNLTWQLEEISSYTVESSATF